MGCGGSVAVPETARRASELPYWPLEEPELSREVKPEARLKKLLENRQGGP